MEKVTDKLFNWASIIDEQTIEQAKTTSGMSFIFPHLALMPDAHLGKGSTVGSVVPTLDAIMPACVGVDIGCGMMAVKTSHKIQDHPNLNKKGIHESISSQIPLSAGKYNNKIKDDAVDYIAGLQAEARDAGFDPADYAPNWKYQIGSLGSGNHFIEVTVDEEGYIWLFLHSGSRGVGNKIAVHHIKVAQDLNKKWHIDLPDQDLAYLPAGTDEFNDYIRQMTWAQKFAFDNRQVMMSRVKAAFIHHAGEFEVLEEINCHHNFTQKERHWGKDLWITRKGAIQANPGQLGLIPGSMGDLSYVVEGLGDPTSFNSAPHGAGRQHARNAARKLFTMEDLEEKMQGIEWSHSSAFLDEHPEAYKPIDTVMEDAVSLVKIKHKLKQIINVKGD
jgi:tRNA-splicing ligase RtcB